MKIVSWNCNGALRKKIHLLDALKADIFVIQECESPETSTSEYKNWAQNYLWVGSTKHKGIGIFAKPSISLTKLEWDNGETELFLPCSINQKINLVAVWTKKSKSQNLHYIGQLWRYIKTNETYLLNDPTIICGDFNSNTCWDKKGRIWNHSEVVRDLANLGMNSLYHILQKENQGNESNPTLYMQRKLEKPYHIDYAFLSKELINHDSTFEIGTPSLWLEYSDHMPITFTISL